ncbi:MAG TPA: 5-oxoprolinase subunit PxpA [Gammaproteobacteria bacterium]|nr:5-oxoprolinase subunit PxpA [Gammaproteobacteria bacterium]
MRQILDINCDCGESFGNWKMGMDEEVMPKITTANIACGFHGGDPVTLLKTVQLALDNGVRIGCHPGFPDLLGFGRRRIAISAEDTHAYLVYQIGAIQGAVRALGGRMTHVKPHGALHTMLQTDEVLARAVCQAVVDTMEETPVIYFAAPHDRWILPKIASEMGIRMVPEVYPDLSYDDAGNVIVQRTKQMTHIEHATSQLAGFLDRGEVTTETGISLKLEAESVCVHGDGPNALAVIDALRAIIAERGIVTRALVD